jgi:hypothetical protein
MGRSLPSTGAAGASRDLLFMKKGWAPVLITFAAAALGLFGIRFVRGRGGLQVRDFLPAETVFLLHVPNAETTLRRWKSTALAAMGDEPEVRSFLAKPHAALLQNEVFAEGIKAWMRVVPSEGFFALATLTDAEPKGVAGLRFAGSQDRLMELHARVKRKISSRFPQAQTQLLTHGASDLEVLTVGAVTVACAFRYPWFFVANDVELLKSTLDRCDGKTGMAASSLRANPLFDQATLPLPKDPDIQVFGQLSAVFDSLEAFERPGAAAFDALWWAQLRKKQAFAGSTKLEGKRLRDSFFVFEPGRVSESGLEQRALSLSSSSTLFYWVVQIDNSLRWPSLGGGAVPFWARRFSGFGKALADRGFSTEALGKVFGPELGVFLEWPAESNRPVLTLALDLRDRDRARGLLDSMAELNLGEGRWVRQQRGDTWVYTAPTAPGLTIASPALGLMDGFLLFSLSDQATDWPMSRLKGEHQGLASIPAFEDASRWVVRPSGAFGYLDLRSAFERAYGTFRPFIGMALALAPETAGYVDASKLPGVEPIARHLSPVVFSSSTTEHGTFVESVGPVALSQIFFGAAGAALGASMPKLKALDVRDAGERLHGKEAVPARKIRAN